MFWQRYVELCNSKGEAPNVVAAKVGVKSSGTVTGWKNGALPRVSVLTKLADYFEVQMSELTGEGQKEKPPAQGGEPLDPVTRELLEIVDTSTPAEREMMLDMIRVIKKQRGG